MIPRGGKRSLVALALLLSAVAAVLAHLAMAEGFHPALGAALSLVPLVLVLAWFMRRQQRRGIALAVATVCVLALWIGWDAFQRSFSGLFFIEHVTVNIALAVLFGRTLAPDAEPLCTRFARIMHGGLPPGVAGYTRQLTLAWTLFFICVAAISCVLYAGGWVALWSAFATLATPLLLAAMFVVEYAVRLRVLPEVERIGILGGIRAFTIHLRGAHVESPR